MRDRGNENVLHNESLLEKFAKLYETPHKSDKDCVRITRSMSKVLNSVDKDNLSIVEVYRCMPLLGNEDNVPNWQVHFIKYSIEFVKK